jgi:hypothetical protein
MTFETAQDISRLMLDISGRLDASTRMVMETSDNEEFVRYRTVIGKLMGQIYFDVLKPIYDKYPALIPDELKQP